MDSGIIEHLIWKATDNWKNYVREINNRKVLFLLGASGSGKTSLGRTLESRWEDDKALLIHEVGGELRKLSASDSGVFEVPFEFTNLSLEVANMSCIVTEDYGNILLIVDGGLIQDFAHLQLRIENLDDRMLCQLKELYKKTIIEWFAYLPNAYFLLLRHRIRSDYNKAFEGHISMCLSLATNEWGKLRGRSAIFSSDLVTSYLLSQGNIPSLESLLDRMGNFVKLS